MPGTRNVAATHWLPYVVHVMLFAMTNVLYFFNSALPSWARCPIWLLSVESWCLAFQLCLSYIFSMILRRFRLPVLSLVSLCFYIPHLLFCVVKSAYFKTFSVLSLSHVLTWYVFVITQYGDRFIVSDGSFSFYLLIPQYDYPALMTYSYWLVQAHTNVPCLIVRLFPCIC
jgi:hypothetical protein